MVQQMTKPEFGEYGTSNTVPNPPCAKKAALRDVQNQIRGPNNLGGSSPLPDKNGGQSMDTVKISGIKRPSPESQARSQAPNSNAANAQLVYVRRKSEAEIGKVDGTSSNTNPPIRQQLKSPAKEPKAYRLSAFPPMPNITSASGKPPVSVPIAQSNYHPPFASANGKEMKRANFEERYRQLQVVLKKLDESDQEDYIQMLQSLSSVELSRRAVELEKRSIQLSLEEAKEIQRVAILNVLGRNLKAPPPSVQQLQSSK